MFIFLLYSSLSSVSSVPRLPLVAVAYLEGTLAVYDMSTQVLRHSFRHEVRGSWNRKRACIAVRADKPLAFKKRIIKAGFTVQAALVSSLSSPQGGDMIKSAAADWIKIPRPPCSLRPASSTCSGRTLLRWCPPAASMVRCGCGMLAPAVWCRSTAATRQRSSTSPSTGIS